MDYQLWFYIVLIAINIRVLVDDDDSTFLRISAGVFLVLWTISLIRYLVTGV